MQLMTKSNEQQAAIKPSKLHDEKLWTVAEAAAYWRVKPRTIYRWIRDGKIKSIPVGRQVRIEHAQILAGVPVN